MEGAGKSPIWRPNILDVLDKPKPLAVYALNSLTDYIYADFIERAVNGTRYRGKRKVRKTKVQRRRDANKAARKARAINRRSKPASTEGGRG